MVKTLTTIPVALVALITANLASAENVEIVLVDRLDNAQSGYCMDVARDQDGQANTDDVLQGHTCDSSAGKLDMDQIFDSSKFSEGILYMPELDVCVVVPSIKTGTVIGLAPCDGSKSQSIQFSGNGTIVPSAAPELCFTLAKETRTVSSDTQQIKDLSIEICSRHHVEHQTWQSRTLGQL